MPSDEVPLNAVTRTRRIVTVSGAGIAGLTAALALQQQGFHVIVLEKQAKASTQGAGIQISPNAAKILASLGLAQSLRAVATAPNSIIIHNGRNGRKLTEFELGAAMRERHGAPYLVLHRADLLHLLTKACTNSPDIEIRYGHDVCEAVTHANGTTLLAQNGRNLEEIQAAALIVADGVWSSLRDRMEHLSRPEFSGFIAWRGLVNMANVPSQFSQQSVGLWLSPNAHLVHYPIRNGQLMNVIAILPHSGSSPPGKGWMEKKKNTDITGAFGDWSDDVQALTRAGSNWGGWPLYCVNNAQYSAMGSVCLIGDACHPMLPFAAQGGAAAIEDAYVLAGLCGKYRHDLAKAFEIYRLKRQKRITKIYKLAQSNRKLYHMGGMAMMFRNAAMSLVPQSFMQKRLDWLYGWENDQD